MSARGGAGPAPPSGAVGRRNARERNASADPRDADPGRRHRPRGRRRGTAHHRGDGRSDRLGRAQRRAPTSSARGSRAGFPDDRSTRSRGRASRSRARSKRRSASARRSANVTLRKLFETYANVRPVREMPGVTTPLLRARRRPGGRPRERRGPLRRHRVHADAGRRASAQAHQRQGLGEDRSVRVRVRAAGGPDEGRLRDEGEHHEVHRGHDEARLREGRAATTPRSSRGT